MGSVTHERDARPDPDALLALSGKETRGRLKVFLGAAPGVGKTFAMLQGAQRLKAEGIDVVLGLVETHGRGETLALVDGLEVLPRRHVEHHGRAIEEFDIDAALARHPRLLVVDELAHTNATDSRHPKRWQDVKELLEAGIDVWTALNIQHLESLADVVSRITGVAVRETVPDTILSLATDVVLVDITPDELIERLNAGKVYVPETARRAIQNFFTIGNLTALRELALRRTADRVDDQMVDYLKQKAIQGPWGTTERLLVCVGADATAQTLVRKASRMATALNASWIAAHAESTGLEDKDAAQERRLGETLRLAESLGGEVLRLTSRDFPGDLLRLARRENVTQIIIGRSQANWTTRLLGRSLSDQLALRARDIGVHIVALADEAPRTAWRPTWLAPRGLWLDALVACVSVGAAIGVGEVLTWILPLPNLSMVFLTAVLFSAVSLGARAAVLASLLSFFAYNFFFITPLYSFTVAAPHELFALLMFLVVAVLTGSLAGRVRNQAKGAEKVSQATSVLYEFSRKLSAASKVDDIVWVAVTQVQKSLGGRALLLLPDGDDLQVRAVWPPDEPLDTAEQSAARWAYEKDDPAGWRTGTLPNVRFRFLPLKSPRRIVGVMAFEPPEGSTALGADQERNLMAIAEQTVIALDRALLVDELVQSAALQENEKIRDLLLASLSHDLRTPLSSITGAVTTLQDLGGAITEEQRQDLLASIEQEASRLTRFVSNLLDMSRIESGAVTVKRDWVDIGDTVRAAIRRGKKAFPQAETRVSLAPNLPFMRGDAHLLEQVLFNLLDNAYKYGGDTGASIHARGEGSEVVISVTDEGPGVKKTDLDRIFEKFYRAGGSDGRRAGTGLGLSICRGLVEAMGGTIKAESPAIRRRGTRLVVRFPAAQPTEERPVKP
jgi:two-component system sensor histidine kinase KdpD